MSASAPTEMIAAARTGRSPTAVSGSVGERVISSESLALMRPRCSDSSTGCVSCSRGKPDRPRPARWGRSRTSHQQDAVEVATAPGRSCPATRRHCSQPRAHGGQQRAERTLALPNSTSWASTDQRPTRNTPAKHRSSVRSRTMRRPARPLWTDAIGGAATVARQLHQAALFSNRICSTAVARVSQKMSGSGWTSPSSSNSPRATSHSSRHQ